MLEFKKETVLMKMNWERMAQQIEQDQLSIKDVQEKIRLHSKGKSNS